MRWLMLLMVAWLVFGWSKTKAKKCFHRFFQNNTHTHTLVEDDVEWNEWITTGPHLSSHISLYNCGIKIVIFIKWSNFYSMSYISGWASVATDVPKRSRLDGRERQWVGGMVVPANDQAEFELFCHCHPKHSNDYEMNDSQTEWHMYVAAQLGAEACEKRCSSIYSFGMWWARRWLSGFISHHFTPSSHTHTHCQRHRLSWAHYGSEILIEFFLSLDVAHIILLHQ